MSPRPPPKISLKHEWTKELGSKVDRQPRRRSCSTIRRRSCSTSKILPTNPTNSKSISWQIGATWWHARWKKHVPSSRINVNSFNEGLSSLDRTVRPVVSEDMMSLNVEQTHDRKRADLMLFFIQLQPKTTLNYVMKPMSSTLTMKYFVKEWKNPLLFMTRIMNRWWWTRLTWTFEFQDYHIPLWKTRKESAFDNWFRELRTTQIDMLFKRIYNRINHLILSVQSQNKWFGMLGTSSYVNYSRRNPKRNAKYVYHTGTLVSSTARADTSCIKKGVRISNSSIVRWTSFPFLITISRKDDLTDIGMVKSRETRNTMMLTNWRRNARKCISKESMIDWYEIQNSVVEWLKILETRNFAENGMLWRMKIIPTIWPHKSTRFTRVTGGFIRTSKVLILCERRTDLTSKRHCLPCSNWNKKKKRSLTNVHEFWQKSAMDTKFFFMVELARFMVDSLFLWESRWGWDQVLTERGDLLYSIWNNSSGQTFLNSITLWQMDRLQLTAVCCNRRRVCA